MDAELLSSILEEISKRVNQQSFNMWFKPISFARKDDYTVYLGVPNEVFRDWISNNYFDVIEESLQELGLDGHHLRFTISESHPAEAPSTEIFSDVSSRSVTYRTFEDGPATGVARALEPEPAEPTLNAKYTFHTFVVGSCNELAHAASLAVAEAPSKTYNPLYVYGGVGLGKTHLMHAIGHWIRRRAPSLRLTYLSSERFMNELINAIRYDRTIGFRDKYRNIDVLLIDDIQFLAGKERTQEEFFHTFNALYEAQKQIVISSDCPPREIPTLEERLHSRFEWGLIADIQPPEFETKVAILKRKAELEGINLPHDVALFIAGKIKSNIRELEGSLIRLSAYASLKDAPIELALATEALRTLIGEESSDVSVELIQKTVAGHFRLKVADLKSKNNSRKVAVPRQVAMYLCKVLTKSSLPEIGRVFGGKHHTTVLHSVNKISHLYDSDQDFHRTIDNLKADLK